MASLIFFPSIVCFIVTFFDKQWELVGWFSLACKEILCGFIACHTLRIISVFIQKKPLIETHEIEINAFFKRNERKSAKKKRRCVILLLLFLPMIYFFIFSIWQQYIMQERNVVSTGRKFYDVY